MNDTFQRKIPAEEHASAKAAVVEESPCVNTLDCSSI
jgi:hypothetical protein